ncbi:hypothetical protein LZ30DRAFT_733381 [Colletotrichum cereale]|nr:hypothetical protein LZ30DRAFT_733381 [Colletotrichum cereale]
MPGIINQFTFAIATHTAALNPKYMGQQGNSLTWRKSNSRTTRQLLVSCAGIHQHRGAIDHVQDAIRR